MKTKEQIEQMPAGKELDALIAEHIFNARRIDPAQAELIKQIAFQFSYHGTSIAQATDTMLIRQLPQKNSYTGADFEFVQPYDYSSRIDSAWAVVEEMRKDGYLFSLFDVIERDGSMTRAAEFMKLTEFGEEFPTGKAKAETDALAISRAALIAKLEEEALNKRGEK